MRTFKCFSGFSQLGCVRITKHSYQAFSQKNETMDSVDVRPLEGLHDSYGS